MTKLKVCDISEGASRVERGTLCVFVCVWYTHSHSWLLPEWSTHGPHLVQQ